MERDRDPLITAPRLQPLMRFRFTSNLLPIPKLRNILHICPSLRLIRIMRACRMPRCSQRHNPPRSPPIRRVVNIPIHRHPRGGKLVLQPVTSGERRVPVTVSRNRGRIQALGNFGKYRRQRVTRRRTVQPPPPPVGHILSERIPELPNRATETP